MTQWYQPRQMQSSGKWHYTCGNTSGTSVYPVGGCAHECPGHATAEQATRHYIVWRAAREIRERIDNDAAHKCEVCGEWTQNRAMFWGDIDAREHAICQTHDIRAHLSAALYRRYKISEHAP